MMRFYLFGGARVVRDGVPLALGKKQQQLLAALILFSNRPVSSDFLIDYLWREDLPSNPLNSLQDVVKRLRHVLGDSGRRLIVTRGRDYCLAVDPDQVDLSIFDRFARAGLALEPAAPAVGRVLLSKALEISEGDLPDAEPGSRASDEIDETYRLRNAVAHALQRYDSPSPDETGVSVPFEERTTGFAIRLPDIEPLTLADVVCEVVRFHGKIHQFTDGLLLASFSGAGAALRCGSEISARLAPSDGLLGGAICTLSSGGDVPSSNPLLQLVSTAARRQILVTANVKEAALASGAAGLLLPYDDDFWQISYGPVPKPPSRPGSREVPIVGREKTIVDIGDLLGRYSLITLRGPGGIGKTRIARELAGRVTRRFQDGIHFVDLAEADHHGGPLSLVVRTLGFVPEPFRHPENTLVDLLGQSERLLILDNCEEFTDEMCSLCEAIGEGCPLVTILTTGRSALGASKELVCDIGELDLGDAAQLMVALAFSEHPDASPDPSDPTILQLCSQLDCVPLAIECAASMVRSMGLRGASAALASLPDGAVLPLLDAAHGGLGRHRSIELALNASYRSLREEEAILLERLSSLRGGFRTEDALGVVADGDLSSVAEGLVLLREASLVKQTGEDKWRILEPVRQFAATRLLRRGEHAAQAARHARHFIALATQAEVGLRGPEEKSWFLRLSDAYANLDKALSWSVGSGDAVGALQLTSSLWWYWAAQGMFVEGARAVERALALNGQVPKALRAKTLVAVSHLAWWAGNPHRTETSLIEAMGLISTMEGSEDWLVGLEAWTHTGLAAARFWGNGDYGVLAGHLEKGQKLFASIGDLPGLGLNLSTHSGIAWQYGHDVLHLNKALESLEVFEQAGHLTMIAHSKRVVGLATAALGAVDYGRPLIEEGLKHSQDLGDVGGLPLGFAFKGLLETWAGNTPGAMSAFRSSILSNRRLGQVWPSVLAIAFGAERASLSHRHTDAIRLNEVVGNLTEMTSIRLPPRDIVRVGQAVERSAGLLDSHELEKVRAEGREMSVPNAMLLALNVFEE
jgi:predicted ATPase